MTTDDTRAIPGPFPHHDRRAFPDTAYATEPATVPIVEGQIGTVTGALVCLDGALDCLRIRVDQLAEHLGPLLAESPSETTPADVNPGECGIARRIHANANQASDLTRTIETIAARLRIDPPAF